jgi:hypothetical protein
MITYRPHLEMRGGIWACFYKVYGAFPIKSDVRHGDTKEEAYANAQAQWRAREDERGTRRKHFPTIA